MKNKTVFGILTALGFITLQTKADQIKYLDFYEEEIRLFGVADVHNHVDANLAQRIKTSFYLKSGQTGNQTPGFAYDYLDKINGDFSVIYTSFIPEDKKRIGFVTSLWDYYYNLDESFSLKFSMKTEFVSPVGNDWEIQLIDDKGNIANGVLNNVNTEGQWKEFDVPLHNLKKEMSFNMNRIKLCEFDIPGFSGKTVIKFDFIRFEDTNGRVFGITDKTMKQRMSEQSATRALRIEKAFEASAKSTQNPAVSAFGMMYLNRDLEKANQMLRDDCKKMADNDLWSLLTTPLYCRFYFWFSSKSDKFPGRLEEETEKLLLKTLWDRTKIKNDIHWARQSTWYLDGSENHDLNVKACNLVSSRIFMNEPDYKDRNYPDYGFGGSYHYGHAGYYGQDVDADSRHGGGRANLKDNREYTAKDHYEAWLNYMKDYFRERARHGFFVENSSPGYSKHTMNMIDLAYAYSGDKELKKIIDDFITLYWADWVQTGIAGISGGPKTRHHNSVGDYGSNKGMIAFHLGGPADAGVWSYWNNISGYEMPENVQTMALDREGMGSFVYRSRGIGEAQNDRPQPLGTERTLVINPESGFLKYSYVTPLYTLSTQMDHPGAIHSHLSKAGRWHGMTVTQDAEARIVPVVFPVEPDFRGDLKPYTMEGMYKTFQNKNTLILQRSRSFSEINPDWFPIYKQRTDQGIYIGNAWDDKIENQGWIFLRKGDVYAAIRVVLWDEKFEEEKAKKNNNGNKIFFHGPEDDPTVRLAENCYNMRDDDKFVVLSDRYSPVIIQAGDKGQFESFESFMTDVLNASVALYKTVVPSFNILVFAPPGEDAGEMVFNAANNEMPMLDGKYITYKLPLTYDSPFLKSDYNSGKVFIEYGKNKMKLDFNP